MYVWYVDTDLLCNSQDTLELRSSRTPMMGPRVTLFTTRILHLEHNIRRALARADPSIYRYVNKRSHVRARSLDTSAERMALCLTCLRFYTLRSAAAAAEVERRRRRSNDGGTGSKSLSL